MPQNYYRQQTGSPPYARGEPGFNPVIFIFRILIIGKSGVGKSSLINKVFGVEKASVSHLGSGQAEIEKELTSEQNRRLIFHDSRGFEPGEVDTVQIAQAFNQRKRNALHIKDRLHVYEFELHRQGIQGASKEDIVECAKQELQEICIKPFKTIVGDKVPFITVSTEEEYEQTVDDLVKLTFSSVEEHVASEPSITVAIAQKVSPHIKIDASLSIDMNALREEIKETISSAIRDKLCSDVDSVTTVSQSITALETNAQYWSDLTEEKVQTLLQEEAPEQMLLEAVQEAQALHFQLDQNTHIREAGLAPEQQVRFRTDARENEDILSRITTRTEAVDPNQRQSTPARSMTAQLDEAVVNWTTEYSSIQNMVRQAVLAASHEDEPEKLFLAKAGVKLGSPPVYSGECNLEKFENWVVSVLQFMSLYNLLGPRAVKVQIQLLGQCLAEIKHWDLESVIIGLQKWFMSTLSLNKVAVNYDNITQGSMTVQQLHQELSKLAKKMIELPDVYSYRRRFMSALKPDIRESVLKEGLTPEFTPIGELVEEAVKMDKDRRVAGARIEEVNLGEEEGQIGEFDLDKPHPEVQQEGEGKTDWDDSPYCFDDEDYECVSMRSLRMQFNMVIWFCLGKLGTKPDTLTCQWDIYLKEESSDYTSVNPQNLKPIFTREQLALSLRATGLILPVLCGSIIMDVEKLHQDSQDALPLDPITSTHTDNDDSSHWKQGSNGILRLKDKIYVPDVSSL
ncbi:hypothetical protein M422DRAFT_273141 [Sphaerobolus stellatus SS14]|uniref:G domain-containing protein n=1 Tax=Sphaerobolus stellatus (strain SS14) TaxID=990650 RepID=A0A0C9U9V8_SPHS4|nr:hypothetical protein M422DRAFT_273141 [Sphaerobolus stellatus SS14]